MTAEQTRMLKHELRTPVNHIIGYSELLIEAAADEGEDRISERAKALCKDGQTLASLIDRHLADFKEAAPEEASESLRTSVTPVLMTILENAEPQSDEKAMWSQDLRRIQAAAQKLIIVLEQREGYVS
jgi:signal transduction histidine kinase